MLQQVWNGISLGSLYGIISLGYTIIFGIIQVIFFAQGEISMLAAFAALGVITLLGSIGTTCSPLVTILAMIFAAGGASILVGRVCERLVLRPLYDAPKVKALITSLGASIVLQNSILLAVGPQSFPFQTPYMFPRWTCLGVNISLIEILQIVSMLVSVYALRLFLRRHKYGLAIRAIAQSRTGALLMGVSPTRATVAAFILASTTAAIAGFFMAAYYGVVRFDMGFLPGIKGFTVAILGGVGNIRGAMLGGILLGLFEAFFSRYVSSDYCNLFVFAVLIMTLIVRPHGLLGEGE